MNQGYDIFIMLIVIAVLLVIFLVAREFWCWYFKLNKIVENQEKENQLLKTQIDLLSLLALKNGVPDKKILQALNRQTNDKLIAIEWIESKTRSA